MSSILIKQEWLQFTRLLSTYTCQTLSCQPLYIPSFLWSSESPREISSMILISQMRHWGQRSSWNWNIPGKWKSQNLTWECVISKPMHRILIIPVENQEQYKCLARGKNSLWYIHNMGLAINNNVFGRQFNNVGNTSDKKLSENNKILKWVEWWP